MKLNILIISLLDDGSDVSTIGWRGGRVAAFEGAPTVAVVTGRGVITKDLSANMSASVIADNQTFISTVSGDLVTFMRREKVALLLSDALYVECLPANDDAALEGVWRRFQADYVGWRHLPELAPYLMRCLMWPVLGTLLALLIVNFALSGRVNDDFQATNAELAALRKTSAVQGRISDRRRAVLEEYSFQQPLHAARLADQIGAAVPSEITLTELSIAPVTRPPEKGKPLSQLTNTVIIRGETTEYEAITRFVSALVSIGEVRLASVEGAEFKIEIAL